MGEKPEVHFPETVTIRVMVLGNDRPVIVEYSMDSFWSHAEGVIYALDKVVERVKDELLK